MRGFLHQTRASVAIESAAAITVLVLGFGGLMEIVQASYTDDRMGRAARAAARALALDPSADTCASIRREIGLADDFDCGAAWTLKVDLGVDPASLPATLEEEAGAVSGDMVLVRIGWSRDRWSFEAPVQDENPDDDAGAVPMAAFGLARCEAELCGQGTP